jgi:cytochrome c551/c552
VAKRTSPPPASPSSDSDSNAPLDEEFMRQTAFVPDAISDPADDAAAPGAGASEDAEAIAPEIIASALGPSFQAVFHFLATKRGDHWELVEFEKTALVKGWTPILQHLLAKLGNQEQVLLTLAIMSTAAIVGGKAAQDIKRASSMANTRMPASAASSVSSASAAPEKPLEQSGSFEEDAA